MTVDAPKYPLEVWYIPALYLRGVCLFVVEPELQLAHPTAGTWHLHRLTVHLN